MFGTDRMICPMNRSFNIANHGVNPMKQCIVWVVVKSFGIDWMMQIHDFTYARKWPVTISRYNTIIMKMLYYPAIYFSGGKWSDFAHSHVHWMPFVVMGDCSKKRRFSCCSAATLSAFFYRPSRRHPVRPDFPTTVCHRRFSSHVGFSASGERRH